MFLCGNHQKFWTFSILQLWNKFSEKRKHFPKKLSTVFQLKLQRLKTQHCHIKLPRQMSRQLEEEVQSVSINKDDILPVTILFFWKFCFSLRTSHEELIWRTNYLKMSIFILFVGAGVLFKGAFFLWVYLSFFTF